MKKLLFALSVFLFSGISLWSQSPEENHKKYWYYRYRLKENFMLTGKGQGESLILSQRHGPNADSRFGFGDQTVLLGQYIAVLAMEYYNLKRNGQNTDETLNDLFHAMYAINRLDMNAENLYSGSLSSSTSSRGPLNRRNLNGFFVKDDADATFCYSNNFLDHLNNGKVKSLGDDPTKTITIGGSQWWESHYAHYNPYSSSPASYGYDRDEWESQMGSAEFSQDQLYYLLFGMRMIIQFIPPSTVYKTEIFQDLETDINKEASNIALRLTSHLNHTGINYVPTAFGNWAPVNLSTGQRVHFQQNPYGWSYATGEVTADICSPYLNFPRVPGLPHIGPPKPHTSSSLLIADNLWYGIPGIVGTRYLTNTPDNAHMVGLLNAMFGTLNTDPIHRNGYLKYEMFHVPLIRQILHGGTNPVDITKYEAILNDAPCDGPYIFGGIKSNWGQSPVTGDYSYEFCTSDRITHPERRASAASSYFKGEFPGIDYMLYHNLYYTVHQSDYPNPINYINTNIKKNILAPLQLHIMNNIEINSIVGDSRSSGIVELKAGNRINFKPGFKTQPKSIFHASTGRIDCSKELGVIYGRYNNRNGSTYSIFKPDSIPSETYQYKINDSIINARNSPYKTGVIKNPISISPVPATTFINITLKNNTFLNSEFNVYVYSANGKKIDEFIFTNQKRLNITNYQKGIYFISFINTTTHKKYSQKIIKQ